MEKNNTNEGKAGEVAVAGWAGLPFATKCILVGGGILGLLLVVAFVFLR
jgi:hypothetical protein